eukprot:gene11674-biopygen9344
MEPVPCKRSLLSVATPEAELRQSDKACLRNFLIAEANASINEYTDRARWTVDGMASIRSLKPSDTYLQWCESLLARMTPRKKANAISLNIVMDTYHKMSIKEGTRRCRGNTGPRVRIQGFHQKMPQGYSWEKLVHGSENKNDLIKLIFEYLKFPEDKARISLPVTVNNECQTWNIDQENSNHTLALTCNHEEADTRMVLHAAASEKAVVVSKDTDVLILLLYAYAKVTPGKEWCTKYDTETFACISKTFSHWGAEVCCYLPQLHAITGCDTTSYFYGVGKVRTLKKVLKNPQSLLLIQNLGKEKVLSEEDIASSSEDDEEWEHLSDFLSHSSDSDNSGSDWTPF